MPRCTMDSNENGNNSTLEQSPKINGNDTHSDTTKEQDASVPLEDTQNDFNWDDEEFGKEQVNPAIAVTTDNVDDDEFGDFDDFATPIEAEGDDDFGDFGDFETTEELQQESFADQDDKDNDDEIPKTPTKTEEYIHILEAGSNPEEAFGRIADIFAEMWSSGFEEQIQSPTGLEQPTPKDTLCTERSASLWDKLSRDSVFYNPITGAVGQFQWTRSESNRAYLSALGVTVSYEDTRKSSNGYPNQSSTSNGYSKRPHSNYLDTKSKNGSAVSVAGQLDRRLNSGHARSASLSGVNVAFNGNNYEAENGNRKIVEEEPELDIDIAKAYCELTEETIRVFPNEKLKSMITELSRLQRQASEYLGYLLDQREQLMMDAETYNDLISCIVGHAQRLREQNVGRDASPAMVSKRKKPSGLSMLRRKQNTATQATFSASMGGGVVGVKQQQSAASNAPKKAASASEGRRSM